MTCEHAERLDGVCTRCGDCAHDVILNGGKGTIVDIDTWTRGGFEALMAAHPKGLIRFAG